MWIVQCQCASLDAIFCMCYKYHFCDSNLQPPSVTFATTAVQRKHCVISPCWIKKNDVAKMRWAGTASATSMTVCCLSSLWCTVTCKRCGAVCYYQQWPSTHTEPTIVCFESFLFFRRKPFKHTRQQWRASGDWDVPFGCQFRSCHTRNEPVAVSEPPIGSSPTGFCQTFIGHSKRRILQSERQCTEGARVMWWISRSCFGECGARIGVEEKNAHHHGHWEPKEEKISWSRTSFWCNYKACHCESKRYKSLCWAWNGANTHKLGGTSGTV